MIDAADHGLARRVLDLGEAHGFDAGNPTAILARAICEWAEAYRGLAPARATDDETIIARLVREAAVERLSAAESRLRHLAGRAE